MEQVMEKKKGLSPKTIELLQMNKEEREFMNGFKNESFRKAYEHLAPVKQSELKKGEGVIAIFINEKEACQSIKTSLSASQLISAIQILSGTQKDMLKSAILED